MDFVYPKTMVKLSIAEGGLKLTDSTARKVDIATVAAGLGAEHYLPLRLLTKEEVQEYEPIGGPYIMEAADEIMILRNAGSMLSKLGKSLDEVVGYRILDADEEQEFRRQCTEQRDNPRYLQMPVVRYYGKKK